MSRGTVPGVAPGLYVASVPAANWLIRHLGTVVLPVAAWLRSRLPEPPLALPGRRN